jgi:hypothetical protein
MLMSHKLASAMARAVPNSRCAGGGDKFNIFVASVNNAGIHGQGAVVARPWGGRQIRTPASGICSSFRGLAGGSFWPQGR